MKPSFKDMLPEYPATRHLPWKPNNRGDKVATELEASVIFNNVRTYVQEKIDGANCGMGYLDGFPVVRNRTKILRKGQQLKNPSVAQFASAWNWMPTTPAPARMTRIAATTSTSIRVKPLRTVARFIDVSSRLAPRGDVQVSFYVY